MGKSFYCDKCKYTHQSYSKISKKHKEHKGEKPADPPADPVIINVGTVTGQPCIGVKLSVKPGSNRENARQVLIDYVDKTISGKYGEDGLPADVPYLTIALSCDGSVNYDRNEIPLEDVPCSCGDESHWILKYEDAAPEDPSEDTPEPSPLKPPRTTINCSVCQDTGMKVVGHNANGRALMTFCKCGKESYDEKIGLLPRRNHNTESHAPTTEEAEEANHRMTRGGTHEEYLAQLAD